MDVSPLTPVQNTDLAREETKIGGISGWFGSALRTDCPLTGVSLDLVHPGLPPLIGNCQGFLSDRKLPGVQRLFGRIQPNRDFVYNKIIGLILFPSSIAESYPAEARRG